MAKGQHLTPHQKRIVRNYYANRDTLMFNRLSELASDLYVCDDRKKADRLWKRVETALKNMSVRDHTIKTIVGQHDLKALARLLSDRC
ncbi:unnamed protein product [marine sediment metagenome]|uniref:Uncharacterized protein n=1 Tax=marine sediment metagenome TaxID=412755 RepID=X0UHW2_9ZZZZ